MRFELCVLVPALAAASFSCAGGGGTVKTAPNLTSAGPQPTFYASASTSAAVGAGELLLADTKAGLLHRFALAPLALQRSTPLPFSSAEQSVLVADDGSYTLVISGGEYAVVGQGGQVVKNPVELSGRINGVAYDGGTHHLALFDDLGATALLALAPGGTVLKSFVLGPVLTDTEHLVSAAAMTTGGQLVLALDGKSLAVADFDGSLSAGAWRFASHGIAGASAIDWLAGVAGQPDLLLGRDGGNIFTVDAASGEVVDLKDVSGATPAGAFRGARPSLATSMPGGKATLWFPDAAGKIASATVLIQTGGTIRDGVVDVEGGTITLVSGADPVQAPARNDYGYSYMKTTLSPRVVERYRIADSLIVARQEVPEAAKPVLTPRFLVYAYDSELGLLERRDYATHESHLVQLADYNLKAILARAAK